MYQSFNFAYPLRIIHIHLIPPKNPTFFSIRIKKHTITSAMLIQERTPLIYSLVVVSYQASYCIRLLIDLYTINQFSQSSQQFSIIKLITFPSRENTIYSSDPQKRINIILHHSNRLSILCTNSSSF